MSDIWSAVQWWDEWQLRILVLSSLSLQWFLVLVVPLRNYTIQRWLRACFWLACICADVLAIYAFATLLYRQAAGRWISSFDDYYSRAQQGRSLTLEVLWAPLLLVHLGGREELTANNMEDTALWVRHAAVLVTVTVYAFSTSLRYFSDNSDGRRLLASAVLLLVAAVVSSCGKPYKCWKELKPRGTAPMLSQGDKVQMLLSGLSLHAARATLETRKKKKPDQKILEPLNPWRREQHQALEPSEVDKIMKPWLRQTFGLIYTREAAMFTPAYLACHALLVPSLYVAATVLFFFAVDYKKHGYSRYSRADVNTTYALLCFTAALDVFGMFVSEMVHWLLSSSGGASSCENVPGHNLMDSVLWTIRRPRVSMLLLWCYKGGSFVKDKDRLYGKVEDEDKNKNKDDKVEDKDIIINKVNIILNKVSEKDKNKENFDLDLSSYRSLSKRNWILRDKDLEVVRGNKYQNIRASLRKKPFDESVLIWHIATDLCFRVKSPDYFRFRPPLKGVVREVCTEAISNYMAYLLDFQPEMLMAGSRQHLFTEAMANMECVIRKATKGLRPKLREKQPLDDVILRKIKEEAASLKEKEAYTVIDDACKLAQELLGIQDHETRWELMHRVWVGMLCYSASMCRSDLHAKSLGEGGEFLSNVWLLISLIGGRTLADKLQMPDDDPEPEGKVVEDPAKDKGEQKPKPEAADKVLQTPDSESKEQRRNKVLMLDGYELRNVFLVDLPYMFASLIAQVANILC
ncbi:unnamed protein product [Miscanthus lutarioriparius]|uniref:DUF4220 domain-containing protein n=1 Tax=Miscanthus lutarioriparius TaxID=422564 RepID=A0A811REZ6_9POAL|nr:unnamed protein product [Miscanthus lutarioriparius]